MCPTFTYGKDVFGRFVLLEDEVAYTCVVGALRNSISICRTDATLAPHDCAAKGCHPGQASTAPECLPLSLHEAPSEIARTGSHTGRQQWSRLLPSRSARGLQALLERFGCPAVSLSEPFKDGLALLRVAEQRGLAGVVSKRHDAPYRSGECVGIGARSRRPPGARPTGSGSGCSSDHSHASPQDAARTRPAPVSASGSGALYGAM